MLQTLADLTWAWGELQSVCRGFRPVIEEDGILVVEWVLGRDSTHQSQHTILALISPRQGDQIGPVWFNRLVDSTFCVHIRKIICLIGLIKGHCALRIYHVDNPIAKGGNWAILEVPHPHLAFPFWTLCGGRGPTWCNSFRPIMASKSLKRTKLDSDSDPETYCSYSIVATLSCPDRRRFWISEWVSVIKV